MLPSCTSLFSSGQLSDQDLVVCCVLYIFVFDQTRRFYFVLCVRNITLIDASKKVSVDVNAEKTKYMLLFRQQNSGQSHNINIGNMYFENVAQFIYS
jgi:hypothetical protein